MFLVASIFLASDLMFAGLVFLVSWLAGHIGDSLALSGLYWLLFFVKVGISVFALSKLFISWGRTQYFVRNSVLNVHEGDLTSRELQGYMLVRLKSVSVERDFMGKRMGYGDLILQFSDDEVRLKYIQDPERYTRVLEVNQARAEQLSGLVVGS